MMTSRSLICLLENKNPGKLQKYHYALVSRLALANGRFEFETTRFETWLSVTVLSRFKRNFPIYNIRVHILKYNEDYGGVSMNLIISRNSVLVNTHNIGSRRRKRK
jgi:hypothetical protein